MQPVGQPERLRGWAAAGSSGMRLSAGSGRPLPSAKNVAGSERSPSKHVSNGKLTAQSRRQ